MLEGFIPGIDKGRSTSILSSPVCELRVDRRSFFHFQRDSAEDRLDRLGSEYSWAIGVDGERREAVAGQAISIYEMHLGSWRRVPRRGNRSLSYRELAPF